MAGATRWQAHATFSPAGEMYFGLEAGTPEEARDAAGLRLAGFGLPVAALEVTLLAAPQDRSRPPGDDCGDRGGY